VTARYSISAEVLKALIQHEGFFLRGTDMADVWDVIIIGAGPGGIAAAVSAEQNGKTYVILEKGERVLQGIIETYPKGKPVYPTIPKSETGSFPIEELTPPKEKIPVEQYVEQIEELARSRNLNIRFGEEYQNTEQDKIGYAVHTAKSVYRAKNIIFAFGSNIPNELGIYGEAKTVARKIDNKEVFLGVTTLVIGGGNAAADVVSALSRFKRENNDHTPVYWAHTRKKFEINKDTARDLGEEILLGGQIKILQGAVPKIGEVDSEGIDRLYIHQTPWVHARDEVFMYQGMSFPMKNVIACIGTHGPSAIFNKLNLQQITCMGAICKIAKEGERLLLLTRNLETSRRGIYAIGGSISPSYMEIQEDGTIREKKHSNLIYTAVRDGVIAINGILSESQKE
jgi:thioredoxin reductase